MLSSQPDRSLSPDRTRYVPAPADTIATVSAVHWLPVNGPNRLSIRSESSSSTRLASAGSCPSSNNGSATLWNGNDKIAGQFDGIGESDISVRLEQADMARCVHRICALIVGDGVGTQDPQKIRDVLASTEFTELPFPATISPAMISGSAWESKWSSR